MTCKERGRHRFKPSLREQMMGVSLNRTYKKCFDCGFKIDPEEKEDSKK